MSALTPASIEADCATLVDSLSALVRCARVVSASGGAEEAGGAAPTSSPAPAPPLAPALVPAVAERLIASAASLAGAAAELRRRAALSDVSRRVAAVRASRKRLGSAAERAQRELDSIADEIAESVTVRTVFFFHLDLSTSTALLLLERPPPTSPCEQALDLHLASSEQLPASRGSPLAYRAGGNNEEEEQRLADALCASLGGYF